MKWKVCGMRDVQNVMDVLALQPDFIGFIFYKKSERAVNIDSLISFLPNINTEVKKVGVFVNEEINAIIELVHLLKLDLVQLHGEESIEDVRKLANAGIQIVKAFHIDEHFDWSILTSYAEVVSYFLFDTKGAQYGGNGTSFDWSLLRNYKLDIPYFLSGGLDLVSVDAALQLPFPNLVAIDVNSRFEVRPGVKNIELLKKLKNQLNNEESISS